MADLPPYWDGVKVDWHEWADSRSTLPFHAPADQLACDHCGVVDEPLTCFGLRQPEPGATFPVDRIKTTKSGHQYTKTIDVPAWPVIDLTAARCRHCHHDVITDTRTGTTWDLDATDYGPQGSTEPTPEGMLF
jgi:hypothetical protein